MSEQSRELLKEALRLPEKERARIASQLLRSLEGDEAELSREEWAEAWGPEIERRIRDIDEAKTALIDGDEVFKELRAKYPKR